MMTEVPTFVLLVAGGISAGFGILAMVYGKRQASYGHVDGYGASPRADYAIGVVLLILSALCAYAALMA